MLMMSNRRKMLWIERLRINVLCQWIFSAWIFKLVFFRFFFTSFLWIFVFYFLVEFYFVGISKIKHQNKHKNHKTIMLVKICLRKSMIRGFLLFDISYRESRYCRTDYSILSVVLVVRFNPLKFVILYCLGVL